MSINFPGKQSNENVLMVIRKHVIVYLRLVLFFFLITIFPLIAFVYFWSNIFPSVSSDITTLAYLGASIYFLYSLIFLIIFWIDEAFDLFILTDQRLIDITQVSFFKRKIATTPLAQIQDTTSDVYGVFGTILNYGDINIKTAAGDASDFSMEHVSDPAMVSRKILEASQRSRGIDWLSPES